jgi:hypothetical protein
MRKIIVATMLIATNACAPMAQQVSQPDTQTRYLNATNETCGASDFSNVTKKNVMKLHECLAYFQESILLPEYPYRDLFMQTITQRGVLAEKFHQGKISKQEFSAGLATTISNATSQEASRNFQAATLQQQSAALAQQQEMQRQLLAPTTTICQNSIGIGNPVACTSTRGRNSIYPVFN